jgi:hypothetical protein
MPNVKTILAILGKELSSYQSTVQFVSVRSGVGNFESSFNAVHFAALGSQSITQTILAN